MPRKLSIKELKEKMEKDAMKAAKSQKEYEKELTKLEEKVNLSLIEAVVSYYKLTKGVEDKEEITKLIREACKRYSGRNSTEKGGQLIFEEAGA